MSEKNKEHKARREKVDPADAVDTTETFLPGQIPVTEADSEEADEERRTEQQPNPVEAEIAVNPELSDDVKTSKDRKSGD